MSRSLLLWGVLVTNAAAQFGEVEPAVRLTGVVTLYRYDDLRSSWGFTTGDYGLVEQDGELRNRNSQVALGSDEQGRDVLRFGVQGGEEALAVDIGDPRDSATQRSLFHRLTRQSVLQRLQEPGGVAGSGGAIELGHVWLVRIDNAEPGLLLAKGEPLVVALRIADHEPGRSVSFRWRVFIGDARAYEDRAKLEAGRINDAVEMFFLQNSRLPTLQELVTPDTKGQAWLRGHEGVPRDPWGHEYRLIAGEQPSTFEVRSDGPDGRPDTEDDISSKAAHQRRR